MNSESTIAETLAHWKDQWPLALKVWSNYVKLREPEWCTNDIEAKKSGITGSFAMIRLKDHRIVIDIRKVVELKLQPYPLQVLSHEIGHHIYTPANLKDNATILSKIRWSLAGIEDKAPMVANLYTDLLINDRLHRSKELDMAIIYRRINLNSKFSKLWTLYMRTYEYLWKLKRGELTTDKSFHNTSIDADASLIASMIRSYSKNWLDGAIRFGAMLYPYLMDEKEAEDGRRSVLIILDTEEAGKGGGIVTGMTEIDRDILDGVIDPRKEAMGGINVRKPASMYSDLPNEMGGFGPEQRCLAPGVYVDLLRQVNPNASEQELINNYYKEIALPYLIDFPSEVQNLQSNTLPEGVDLWDVGDSIDEIDWIQTSIHSAQILPGVNTLKRTYGPSGEEDDLKSPMDVYLGIDCSGSMVNPIRNFSWPVLAATIIALSALRAGAKVMGCLSGEPGSFLQNKGFESEEKEILTVITSYLGTGYGFGINRLKDPFGSVSSKKSHVIMVTDDDLFHMLDAETDTGEDFWEVIEITLSNAGGSGTIVLHSQRQWHQEEIERLKKMGWNVHYVTNQEEMLTFAADFSKINY